MSAIANSSAKIIWLVEHYADSTCLLGSVLQKWHYQIVRILDSEVLAGEIELTSNFTLADLIILDVAPPQKNVIQLIEYFRYNLALSNVPLLCLFTSGTENRSQVITFGASNALNKPFELEKLYLQLQELLAEESHIQQSEFMPEMTLVFSEIKSSSSIKEQEHWLKVFQEHSEQDAWKLLIAAGYEVKIPTLFAEK